MYYHVEGLGFTHLTAINTNMGCIYKSPLRSQKGPHSFVPAERLTRKPSLCFKGWCKKTVETIFPAFSVYFFQKVSCRILSHPEECSRTIWDNRGVNALIHREIRLLNRQDWYLRMHSPREYVRQDKKQGLPASMTHGSFRVVLLFRSPHRNYSLCLWETDSSCLWCRHSWKCAFPSYVETSIRESLCRHGAPDSSAPILWG